MAGCGYAYREFPAVWRPSYVRYRREQHVRPHPRSQRTDHDGARLQHFLYEPAPNAMSDEEHASRRAIVIRDEEFVEELEVRSELRTKRHAGFLGPRTAALVRVTEPDVGRQAEMGVCEDRHGGGAGWR